MPQPNVETPSAVDWDATLPVHCVLADHVRRLIGRVASLSTADNGDRRDEGITSERNAFFTPTVMPQPNVAPRSAVDRDAPLPMRADGFRAITQRRRKMIRAMTRTGRNDGSCDDALVGSHPYRPPITVISATKASPPNETRFFRQRSCHNRTFEHGRRSIGMRPYRVTVRASAWPCAAANHPRPASRLRHWPRRRRRARPAPATPR